MEYPNKDMAMQLINSVNANPEIRETLADTKMQPQTLHLMHLVFPNSNLVQSTLF